MLGKEENSLIVKGIFAWMLSFGISHRIFMLVELACAASMLTASACHMPSVILKIPWMKARWDAPFVNACRNLVVNSSLEDACWIASVKVVDKLDKSDPIHNGFSR